MKPFAPHPKKTNSKFILKIYDKNLSQKYGGFVACEIPISWDFSGGFIPFLGDIEKKMDKKHAVKQKMLIFEPFYESSFLLICPMFLAIWFI